MEREESIRFQSIHFINTQQRNTCFINIYAINLINSNLLTYLLLQVQSQYKIRKFLKSEKAIRPFHHPLKHNINLLRLKSKYFKVNLQESAIYGLLKHFKRVLKMSHWYPSRKSSNIFHSSSNLKATKCSFLHQIIDSCLLTSP